MRHLRIHLLAATAVALASSQPALAADMGMRQPLPPPPPYAAPAYVVPYYDWTGFYVGGNLGYGFGSGDGTVDVTGVGTGPISGDGNGFIGGLQAGYNWQFGGGWLFGIETDIQYGFGEGDVTGSPGAARLTAESKNPWFGTLRGRIGYANDRLLGYVTGGVAYGQTEWTGRVTGPGGFNFDVSESFTTWTVGGGVEYAMWGGWTGKLEYLYFGSPSDAPTPPRATLEGDASAHLIRTGINYRF